MKYLKTLSILVMIVFTFFITSCDTFNNPVIDVSGIENNYDKTYSDFILFKVLNKNLDFQDVKKNKLNVIEVEVIKNFNKSLTIDTNFSKFVEEKRSQNEHLFLVISDTYYNYIENDEEYIYKLSKNYKSLNNETNEYEIVFDTTDNEYTIVPILDNKLLLDNITSKIYKTSDADYNMYEIMVLRQNFYLIQMDSYFIDYNYMKKYTVYYFILNKNDEIDHFELVLSALYKTDGKTFEKLLYSDLDMANVTYTRNIDTIDEYLLQIGGMNNE